MKTHDIEINLPVYHGAQRRIIKSKAKRKVICAGRRGGKTTLVASESAYKFLCGERVIYATPVAKQLKDYWGMVKKFLRPLIQAELLYVNETSKMIRWKHHEADAAMIHAQTAHSADNWRGGNGSVLIFDEFAFMDVGVWDLVGAPMLLDSGGEAWFISTPNRKNHFYHFFLRGESDKFPMWESFRFTSQDNPYLDKDAIESMKSDLTARAFKQEILALFLDSDGQVFRGVREVLHEIQDDPEMHKGHTLIGGLDWGKKNDYTAVSLMCVNCKREVHLNTWNQVDYTFQRDMIVAINRDWRVKWWMVEANSIGEPNIELLRLEGMDIEEFWTTASSKPRVIENLVLAIEDRQYQYIDDATATAELESYEMKKSPMTNRPTYSAPSGFHDDTVIARALATWATNGAVPAFYGG